MLMQACQHELSHITRFKCLKRDIFYSSALKLRWNDHVTGTVPVIIKVTDMLSHCIEILFK